MKSQDRAAATALAEVNASARAQLRVLATLQDLVDSAPDDGVVRGVIAAFREERRAAFVRFHERTLKNEDGALDDGGLGAAWNEAIEFTAGVGGDVGAMQQRKAQALSAAKPAVPFFARFLEHQKR